MNLFVTNTKVSFNFVLSQSRRQSGTFPRFFHQSSYVFYLCWIVNVCQPILQVFIQGLLSRT